MSSTVIRRAEPAELELFAAWAAAEGWNPGAGDLAAFCAADPGGFWLSELAGEPIAMLSAVRYGDGFAFIGFYIVRPDQRGQGHGLRLWQAVTSRLQGRVVGLDGVLAQQANYERSGFALAYRNVRYQGTAPSDPAGTDLPPADSIPFDALQALDTACFGAPRPAFLRAWLRLPQSTSAVALRDGTPVGYGVIRRCREGQKVGPLFAPDAATAAAILDSLLSGVPQQTWFLDTPQTNLAAVELAERRGMNPVFETVRMYAGGRWPLPVDRIFGVTSFELG